MSGRQDERRLRLRGLLAAAVLSLGSIGATLASPTNPVVNEEPPVAGGPTADPLGPLGTSAAADTYTLTIPDVAAEIGQSFRIPVHMETDAPSPVLAFLCDTNPSEVLIYGVEPGPALQVYEAIHSEPVPCDIVIYPEGISALMIFDSPFDSSIYGTEILRLIAIPTAATPVDSPLLTIVAGGGFLLTTVHVVEELPDVTRGDVNSDGTCDLSDVIDMVGSLFVPGSEPICADAADIDDDGAVVITDAILLLTTLFTSGDPLPTPCRPDTTVDTLPECPTTACP